MRASIRSGGGAVSSECSPRTLHRLGELVERAGNLAFATGAIVLGLLTLRAGLVAAVNAIGIPTALATMVWFGGESIQRAARLELQDAGEEIPEAMQRERGTFEFLERHAGDVLRTPIGELPSELTARQVVVAIVLVLAIVGLVWGLLQLAPSRAAPVREPPTLNATVVNGS